MALADMQTLHTSGTHLCDQLIKGFPISARIERESVYACVCERVSVFWTLLRFFEYVEDVGEFTRPFDLPYSAFQ